MAVKTKKMIGLGVAGIFLTGIMGMPVSVAAVTLLSSPVATVPGSVEDSFLSGGAIALPVSARILPAGGLTQHKAIDFGRFSVSSAGGIITVSEGAVFHTSGITVEGASGGVTALDAMSSAIAPGDSITVSVMGQSLSGPGASMPLQGFCQSPGSSPGPNNAPCSIIATSNLKLNVIIGGVLEINAAQAPGTYRGVMEVTAEF